MKTLITCLIIGLSAEAFVHETVTMKFKPSVSVDLYTAFRDSIKSYKKLLYDKDKNIYYDKAGKLLHHLVADSFFHYWQGTPWDFYGKTQCPQKGSIACGYFVSTVLDHAGVPVDRVDLAEIASESMIKKVVSSPHIKHYVPFNLPQFAADIKSRGDALYIIGLDYHTGFISCEKGQVWIIHSGAEGVVKEAAGSANTLIYNQYGVTGCLTSDHALIKRWVDNL